MDKGLRLLSELNIFDKYAKHIPSQKRRENWDEICTRYENMMVEKYPKLSGDIISQMKLVRDKKVLPSMRALQFAGPAIERNPARIYNCAFLPVDSVYAFSETMFLLLGGTGVGYSVQYNDIDKLPEIVIPTKHKRYLIQDSIEGWADSIKVLMKSYLGYTNIKPIFDFKDIRPKGSRLVTAGGKAPGPEPLKKCLFLIETILQRKENGQKLKSTEIHDIMCHIADAVLSGGIRRAAMIALFSFDDMDMRACKSGNWWEPNPQRGRANNSAVILRNRITKEEFNDYWEQIEANKSGEPGMYLTNNTSWGTNPCVEIGLRPYQFCNLCEINVSNIENEQDLLERVVTATFFGTLQAGFTDFHYLRPIWQKTTEKDALLGIGMTGIASNSIMKYDLTKMAKLVIDVNKTTSEAIGINPAARTTCVKPSGTTSCVLGTSSGIHAWHNDYYIRRVELSGNNPLVQFFSTNYPELIKPLVRLPGSYCIEIPCKAPEGVTTRKNETAHTLLERVKLITDTWIKPGHIKGENSHNVSTTIYIRDNEWKEVGDWMWNNRANFNGMAVLPYDGGTYKEAPFEDISKETYEALMTKIPDTIKWELLVEENDETNFAQEIACAGGVC